MRSISLAQSTKKLEREAATILPDTSAPIFIFCSGGGRADEARKALVKLGYTGKITNGGMPEDIVGAAPEFMEAAQERSAAAATE